MHCIVGRRIIIRAFSACLSLSPNRRVNALRSARFPSRNGGERGSTSYTECILCQHYPKTVRILSRVALYGQRAHVLFCSCVCGDAKSGAKHSIIEFVSFLTSIIYTPHVCDQEAVVNQTSHAKQVFIVCYSVHHGGGHNDGTLQWCLYWKSAPAKQCGLLTSWG